MMAPQRPQTLPLAYSDPRGSGVPIVFLHGFGHNRSIWENILREAPDAWRPIAVDLRGHGESPWDPASAYDLRDYASDLPRLLESLEIDRAVLVAHSLGGNIATLFAAAWPNRVRSLVLVDTGPSLELSGMAHVLDEVGSALRSYASVAEYRSQLAMTHPSGEGAILDRLAETGVVRRIDGRYELAFDPGVMSGTDPVDASAEMAALERELWTSLRGFEFPVLVLRGGLSAILSEKVAREMVDEALPDGRLVTLASAGHGVMIDDGPGLLSALRDFLRQERG